MAEPVDRMVGRAALARGWVAEARLAEAVAEQELAAGGAARLLGAILVARGDLTAERLDTLLDEQARAALAEEDTLLGATLVRNGLASWDAVAHALGRQLTMRVPKRIGDLLLEDGAVAPAALAATLRAQPRMAAKLAAANDPTVRTPAASAPAADATVREADFDAAAGAPAAGAAVPGPQIVRAAHDAATFLPIVGPDTGTVAPAPAPPPAPPPAPVIAGRYEILKELGRGGMGVVYRARDRQLGREVALKLLLLGDRADAGDLERFQHEIRACAALRHPGIIQVLDSGTTDGNPFYTMELVAGDGLADLVHAQQVAPRAAVEITRQLAAALAFAHAHGVLHRDMKPQNVIVERADAGGAAGAGPGHEPALHAKILDFGLAKFSEREVKLPGADAAGKSLRSLTRTGAMMGTPHYMSPEQTQDAGAVGPPADIYSLGATLYELLTGRPPFDDAATLADLLIRINDQDPAPPRRTVPDVDPDVETVCLKCLQKAPADRYATAADLAEDCRRWLADEPIAARPVGPLVRLWKKARRNRRIAIPIAALAVALLATALYYGISRVSHFFAVRSLRRAVAGLLQGPDAEGRAARKERLDQALKAAEDLRDLEPSDHGVIDTVNHVKSEQAVTDGDQAFAAYVAQRARVEAARTAAETARKQGQAAKRHADMHQMWDRGDELHAAEQEKGRLSAAAISAYTAAVGHEEKNPVPRQRLAELYWDKLLDAEGRHDLSDQKTYRDLARDFGGQPYLDKVSGARRVRVRFLVPAAAAGAAPAAPGGSPPGPLIAYLFRYEPNRYPPVLVPLPCDPQTGEVLGRDLQTGAAPDPGLPPCEPVPLKDALAAPAPAAADPAAPAAADSPAARAVREARWGSVFALRQTTENRLELTPPPAPAPDPALPAGRRAVLFDRTLPKASYLLYVPPGQGVYEACYPFAVARDFDWDEVCELPPESEVPPLPPGMEPPPPLNGTPSVSEGPDPGGTGTGRRPLADARGSVPTAYWSFLPAGPYRASDDPQAQQNPPRDAAWVRVPEGVAWTAERQAQGPPPRPEGLFLARIEVTTAMYLVYLNDRAWQPADAALKRVPRKTQDASKDTAYWSQNAEGSFSTPWRGDWPICAISWQDATDYVKWLTARRGNGQWEFALPTEDEWERAARGADGRFYPWGDDFAPTFCRMMESRTGEQDPPNPEPFGLFRLDEGPFGVRDLAGGMAEMTATTAGPGDIWRILKGGAWCSQGAFCRGAYRYAFVPPLVYVHLGFRLCVRRTR